MKTRIIVGALLTAFLLFVLFTGGYVFLTVIALFSMAAVYEMGLALKAKGYRPNLIPAYAFAAAFPYAYELFGLLALAALYVLGVSAAMILSLFDRAHDGGNAITSLFVFVYPLLFFMCVLLVFDFTATEKVGLTGSFLAFVCPELCDAAAYFGGTFFGKRKLCPALSPKKTVEGSVAAVVGGVLFGALLIPMQKLWGAVVCPGLLLTLGLFAGVFSQFGDLFASSLKRWAGIKDFSSIFPGHGGILDRLDSILLCTPPVLIVFSILIQAGIY